MFVTLEVSQEPMDWLNTPVFLNIDSMEVTLAVFHEEISWLNTLA